MTQCAISIKEMDEIMSRLHRIFDTRITFFDMKCHELGYFRVKLISPFCAAFRRKRSVNIFV